MKVIDGECAATGRDTNPADFHLAVLAGEHGAGEEEDKDVGVEHALNHMPKSLQMAKQLIYGGSITSRWWEHT